ncbi:MAG: tripartite tricarboxylate transporter substrate binding protein [Alphaproteobacteria bacterium]|nr:tripartite tricarboxylate transporter substrate binding protein [Alphaproteobacteria bacterium]
MTRLAISTLIAVCVFAGHAGAQSFPERPITLINPYAAGGPADLLARTIADGMSEALGRPVVVENRPGAGTAIGARAVVQAKPDGYTLFIGGSPSHVITPALMKDANYDGIAGFSPIATVADVPNVLVAPPSRPYKTVKELVAAARAADGKLTFASVGVGSIPQFLGVLLQLRANVKLVEVPYRGGQPAAVDLLGGRVDMAFLNAPAVLSHVRSGGLRALAVAAPARIKSLPDTPTMPEARFPDVTMSTWYGISAPAGTPREVVGRLHAAIAQTLGAQKTKEKIESQGAQIFFKGPEDYAAYLKADAKLMLELIKAANMTPK